MFLKTYGIYLLHPPTVDLKAEGLSRYLAEFLKAAQEREDVRFVIACPSWIHDKLNDFFLDFGINPDRFSIISPKKTPLLLRFYEHWNKPKEGEGLWSRIQSWLVNSLTRLKAGYGRFLLQGIAGARSKREIPFFILVVFLFLIGGFSILPLLIFLQISFIVRSLFPKFFKRFYTYSKRISKKLRQKGLILGVGEDWTYKIYQLMTDAEAILILDLINARKDILAWYSPTAFWCQFNRISAPRLMCVPDVVPLDFPVGFSLLGNRKFVNNVRQVETAIREGSNFVTYSETVKWQTLVDRYQVIPDNIHVIPHGANRLDPWVKVSGFTDDEAATDTICQTFLRVALSKSFFSNPTLLSSSTEFNFIFYASQFRPNKNIISLLKSYKYLLRRRHISQKLVLTGNPKSMSGVLQFIMENNLQYDVLCLVGLSQQELAACYRLADLAVNPTFSEGGCPFTFTEALSVGTPVVMSRISVTEEVIVDKSLQDMMLFDPYDWKDMSEKIEWALDHREALLETQTRFYETLTQRTWQDVVSDHLNLLEKISCSN